MSHLKEGGSTVQKRNLAGLLVRDVESVLEATVSVRELIVLEVVQLRSWGTRANDGTRTIPRFF